MGLMNTLRSALGLQRPLAPRDAEAPLDVTPAARERLAGMPADHGIHVSTAPVEVGRVVHVDEGPSQGPPPPHLEDVPLTASDEDLHHLRGLTLDWRDGRWAVSCHVELRARETPNPDGRVYMADRNLAIGRPLFFARDARFFARGAGPFPGLPTLLFGTPQIKSVLLRDNTLTIEREPGAPWDPLDRAVDAAVRQYFLTCGHALTSDELPEREDPFEAAVLAVLQERIAPGIHRDGGDIQLVGVQDGVVRVSMHGACRTCPASTATLRLGVEKTLKEAFPGQIERVEQV